MTLARQALFEAIPSRRNAPTKRQRQILSSQDLVQFRDDVSLTKQTESWLRFSARQINEQLNQTGPFWQSEPFDHLVRSDEQFVYLSDYVRNNPTKAGLKEGEYLLYER